ncbi:MAG TPA: hypothetical protein VM935_18530 [Chitinophagaceae bacterium]|jgi:hypothetical protein|nr:hypothetical protein [Chitinophagaceae bacterium]
MKDELYFDISSEEKGGSLYRVWNTNGQVSFRYNHSRYIEHKDEIQVFETVYKSFKEFWDMLLQNREWFYLHPLYVHPEQRDFVTNALKDVPWNIHPDVKWQLSHKRQWEKVLTAPPGYYHANH